MLREPEDSFFSNIVQRSDLPDCLRVYSNHVWYGFSCMECMDINPYRYGLLNYNENLETISRMAIMN